MTAQAAASEGDHWLRCGGYERHPGEQPILVLMDSIRALDTSCSVAARTLGPGLTMLFWSFTNAGIRDRRAPSIQLSRASAAGS